MMAPHNDQEGNSLNLESPLSIGTLNVRGLRDQRKTRTLLEKLRNEKIDVVSLQETHLSDESDIETLRKLWGGEVHFSLGTNRSKGVVTLFNPNISENIEFIKSYDRIVFSQLKLDKEKFLIVSIYSPSENNVNAKLLFLQELQTKILHHLEGIGTHNLICLGDFNITLSDLDVISGQPHGYDLRQGFNNFVQTLNMVDTWRTQHLVEKQHTWSRAYPTSARRLDYIFTSELLGSYLDNSYIKSIGFTDHRLVVSKFVFSSFRHGKGTYKLNTSHLSDENYVKMIIDTIHETEAEYSDLNPHLRWEMIKCNIVEVSQQYSRYVQRKKKNHARLLTDQLNDLENTMSLNPNDPALHNEIAQVKNELEQYELEKSKGAQLRAGLKNIKEGEKSTKFFLSLEKSKSNSNVIRRLITSSGNYTHNETELVDEIAAQFEKKYNNNQKSYNEVSNLFDAFTNNITLPSLDDQEMQRCEGMVTDIEVREAIKNLNSESVPGSDGIPTEFYSKFWSELRGPLMDCYHFSFMEGKLSYSERVGILTLFHKGKELPRYILSNWRPISLTNVDYKILAKVFSMRLDKVIDKLIGKQQTGFMKGRQITTVHRLIDDILEHYRGSRSPGILVAIDFKAVFDSINMNCIYKSLEKFGFGPNFIKWIKVLNTDRLACVKNGGHLSNTFNMQNGVRQGCPISPQLFILAVEVLAQKISQDTSIKGIVPCLGEEAIKIWQYADDTSLFLFDTNDLRTAIGHTDAFSAFSDLFLNLNKSFGLSMNGNLVNTGDIAITFKNTIKILGIYFSNEKPASAIDLNWTSRIKNLINHLNQWSKRDISIMGKILVIKTFALSQLIFIMKSLILPPKVITEINGYIYNFLWSKKFNNGRTTEKIRRQVMISDYQSGGLKMVDLCSFQDSILLEWAEALLSGDRHIWKIFPKISFSKVGGLAVFKSVIPINGFKGLNKIKSPFWREVLTKWLTYSNNQELTIMKMEDPINNNKHIRFKGETLFLESAINRSCITLSHFITNNRLLNLTEYRTKFGRYPRDFLDYNAMYNALKNIDLLTLEHNNDFIFKQQVVGKLGRKFFYSKILVVSPPICIQKWERKLGITMDSSHWNIIHLLSETRLKTLWWKIVHNIYPGNYLLNKMGLSNTDKCNYCNEIDDTAHFFFHCPQIRPLWNEVTREINRFLGITLVLNVDMVILGLTARHHITRSNMNKINHAIAIGKMAISKFKYGPNRYLLDIYKYDSQLRELWPII